MGWCLRLRATRPDLVVALTNDSPVLGGVRGFGLRNALVTVQVALSLVLLAGEGLFLCSLHNATSIDIGMKPRNILLLAVDPKLHNYSPEKLVSFYPNFVFVCRRCREFDPSALSIACRSASGEPTMASTPQA